MNRYRRNGFTLVELMVVIFLIGLLILAAAPYLRQSGRGSSANGAARELWTDLLFARTEAIRTGFPHLVEFCTAPGGPPGYVIASCSTGTPPVGSFTAAPCNDVDIDVCAQLQLDGGVDPAGVVRRVVLGRGATPGISTIRTGVAGSPPGTPRMGSAPPADGMDLGACDTSRRRFFFNARGQMVTEASPNSPCTGAIYITGRSNDLPEGNRAVEITSVGTARIYRISPAGGWE